MIRVSLLGRIALGLLVVGSASLPATDITFDLTSGVQGQSSFSKRFQELH